MQEAGFGHDVVLTLVGGAKCWLSRSGNMRHREHDVR